MFPNEKKVLKFQNKKNKYNTAIQYKIINTEKLYLSYKFISKKFYKIYSDFEWKIFLSLRNKHDFSSECFSNLIC